ncbi:cytochrome b/b6 domain-containing protein [Amphritea pacifica]|uniref:Cytochrome b/b6 domain-containing protein n=1 Tax=Amphritea pacifica TaxID=2811233 RepID=A0ABS2WBJ2_9GAMM|nr:cytochrome b/b6 domain-containing protein [Amphritea pacifica]MBN0988991.1 cytochrome b/b6 domain-containing protein [Amphritea pacifica]MBN1009037.1 cytochrome b/b6 domain-containing protein [Amphritea pacifica]
MSTHDSQQVVKVWDPLVRVFHWSLALFFTVAYLTEGDFETVHFYMGYGISALILFRLLWGIIGPKYARFTNFVTGKEKVVSYLKSLLTGNAEHYVGHNPAGGIMVVALLLMLALTCFFGMALIATDNIGPLAGTFVASFNEDLVKELHEICANGTLALVFIHLAGVVVSSLLHRENLIRAMVTGVKVIGAKKSKVETVKGENHV